MTVLLVCILLSIDMRTEAERVQAETVSAIRKLQVLNSGKVTKSPAVLCEVLFFGTFGKQDARNHYMEQFAVGMQRLLELGVLEKRSFAIVDTNAYMQIMKRSQSGISSELLWSVCYPTGVIEVTAKPAEMPKWEALIQSFATNSPHIQRSLK